jgi:hypothetical protein
MQKVSSVDVEIAALRSLRLGAEVTSLSSPEAVAGLVRRAAGFVCPAPARRIVDAVHASAGEWLGDDPRDLIGDAVQELLLHGDLVEVQTGGVTEGFRKAVFLAVPSYVVRASGVVFLHGIVPDHPTALPAELDEALRHRGVVRWLEPRPGVDWTNVLKELSYTALEPDRWFAAPLPVAAREHQVRSARQLERAGAGGDTRVLTVLDPAMSSTFQKGRWVPAGERTGSFVGRRERRFGRPLWCHVDIADGRILHLRDLHDEDDPQVGADAAWHLQMALDACAGTPQRYIARDSDTEGEAVIGLFAPVPSWAERRLLTVGYRLPGAGRGELMAFAIPDAELAEETSFLERALWLKPI